MNEESKSFDFIPTGATGLRLYDRSFYYGQHLSPILKMDPINLLLSAALMFKDNILPEEEVDDYTRWYVQFLDDQDNVMGESALEGYGFQKLFSELCYHLPMEMKEWVYENKPRITEWHELKANEFVYDTARSMVLVVDADGKPGIESDPLQDPLNPRRLVWHITETIIANGWHADETYSDYICYDDEDEKDAGMTPILPGGREFLEKKIFTFPSPDEVATKQEPIEA